MPAQLFIPAHDATRARRAASRGGRPQPSPERPAGEACAEFHADAERIARAQAQLVPAGDGRDPGRDLPPAGRSHARPPARRARHWRDVRLRPRDAAGPHRVGRVAPAEPAARRAAGARPARGPHGLLLARRSPHHQPVVAGAAARRGEEAAARAVRAARREPVHGHERQPPNLAPRPRAPARTRASTWPGCAARTRCASWASASRGVPGIEHGRPTSLSRRVRVRFDPAVAARARIAAAIGDVGPDGA